MYAKKTHTHTHKIRTRIRIFLTPVNPLTKTKYYGKRSPYAECFFALLGGIRWHLKKALGRNVCKKECEGDTRGRAPSPLARLSRAPRSVLHATVAPVTSKRLLCRLGSRQICEFVV